MRRQCASGSHTKKQWLEKLGLYNSCPGCSRTWYDIAPRADKRYKYIWTKDHIVPLIDGGSENIEIIQPLCYSCNFGKGRNISGLNSQFKL